MAKGGFRGGMMGGGMNQMNMMKQAQKMQAEMLKMQEELEAKEFEARAGGGAVLREDNVRALRENGRLYFLDRSLSKLLPTDDRPLARDRAAIEARYRERYGIYRACADLTVAGDGTPEEVAAIIEGDRQA